MDEMKRSLFGTDGIRDISNQGALSVDLILKLGQAVGYIYATPGKHKKVIIAKDTRLSGYLLENALTAGLVSVGVDVVLVGPVPTPAVAMLVKSLRADLGIMVSASHNTYEYNGIKLFDSNGYKLSDEQEVLIESFVLGERKIEPSHYNNLGKVFRLNDAHSRYIENVKNTFPSGQTLDGMKIVLDCNHGSGYVVAPMIFAELGAKVILAGAQPDGYNINKSDADIPELIRSNKADLGVRLDGDADRLTIFDEKGNEIAGDQIIGAMARYLSSIGLLSGNKVVSTILSNIALDKYLSQFSIQVIRSAVGDRYVAEAMKKHNCNFGGEPSGHVIFGEHSTTGDGILTTLQIIAYLYHVDKPASEALNVFKPAPHLTTNIPIGNNSGICDNKLQDIMKEQDSMLSDGRVLIRKSGTEPLLRIIAEGNDQDIVSDILDQTIQRVQEVING